jgi:hypothetical protein
VSGNEFSFRRRAMARNCPLPANGGAKNDA